MIARCDFSIRFTNLTAQNAKHVSEKIADMAHGILCPSCESFIYEVHTDRLVFLYNDPADMMRCFDRLDESEVRASTANRAA